MKSVLTTAAVLIFIATPALAQSFDPDVGTGNITPLSGRQREWFKCLRAGRIRDGIYPCSGIWRDTSSRA